MQIIRSTKKHIRLTISGLSRERTIRAIKKGLIIFCFIAVKNTTNSQIKQEKMLFREKNTVSTIGTKTLQEIEPLDSLVLQVEEEHERETAEAIELFRNLRDYKWLHLIPSIGYNVYTKSPEVSISISQYINYKTNRDTKKYQIEQIRINSRKELDRKIFSLRSKYLRLVKLINEIETRKEALNIDSQIFEI